jgi:hypothetical protein
MHIYRSDDEIDPLNGGAELHTITSFALARPAQMRCGSSAMLAPPGRDAVLIGNAGRHGAAGHASRSKSCGA